MFGVLLSVVLSCVVSFLLNTIFVKRMVAKGGDTSLGESVVPKEAMGSSASSNESTAITNDSSLGVAGVSKILRKSLLHVMLEWDLLQCLLQH